MIYLHAANCYYILFSRHHLLASYLLDGKSEISFQIPLNIWHSLLKKRTAISRASISQLQNESHDKCKRAKDEYEAGLKKTKLSKNNISR